MKIGFHLKNPPNQSGEYRIFMYARISNGQLKIYLPYLTVKLNQWSKIKQRMKPSIAGATKLNDTLDKFETEIRNIIADFIGKQIEPTPELVKSRFLASITKDASRTDKAFFEYWQEWIEQTRNTKTPQTLKVYESAKNQFEKYAKAKGATLTFDRMDREFVNSFTDYMLNVRKVKNPYVWHLLKAWKAFMQWSYERGLTRSEEAHV